MKKTFLMTAFVLSMLFTAQAQASCARAALWAAINVYGNDPMQTRIRQATNDTYFVIVGIGNHEDGAHQYRITFEGPTCDPRTAIVCDLTQPDANDPRVCHM